MFRFLCRTLLLLLASFILAVGIYANTQRFSVRWRGFVMQELEKHGVFIDFARLVINPTGGLVAEDVRLFNDGSRRAQIAAVSHLNLDVNLTRLINGEVRVESLVLSHANVSLPVDPDRPDLTVVSLEDLNAQAVLDGNQIDIRHARGLLSGLRLDIHGVLILPTKTKDDEDKATALERLKFIRQYRAQVQNVLDWLARFQSPEPPQITVEVSGDFNKPQDIQAEVSFQAEELRFENYVWSEIHAVAGYDSGMIDVRRLRLADRLGQIEATATWRMGADRARFRMTSSADIPALARTFFDVEALNEAVFYEPPDLSIEGYWFPGINKGKEAAERVFPAEITGKVECKRFGSRGAIFEGLTASIGVNPDGFYIRDAELRHKTGTVDIQLMRHREQGVRYDATLRMDPNVLVPFVIREKTRDLIRRFEFDEKSHIDVQVAGEGPSFVLQDGVNSGHGVLRNFRYNGVYLEEMEADLAFQGFFQNFRNVSIRHPKGPATAEDVFLNDEQKWVRLTKVHAASDTPDLLRCFAAKTAEHIEKYRLTVGTNVTVDGTIGIREPKYNDYQVTFHSESGEGHYTFLGDDHTILSPDGVVRVKERILSFDVKGSLFQRPFRAVGQTDLTPEVTAWNVDVEAGAYPYEVLATKVPVTNARARVSSQGQDVLFDVQGGAFGRPFRATGRTDARADVNDWSVNVDAGLFPYEVLSKTLDFTGVHAEVDKKGSHIAYDVKSTVLGGGMTLKGTLDESRTPNPYAGELRLDAMNFSQFAKTYSRNDDTSQGDLSGHFKFTGRMDDWPALKGGGSLIIVNGNLMSVPILGPLTPLIGAILPKPIAGYNIAKEADCTFEIADGFFRTRDLEALTTSFRVTSRGDVNFIRDEIDFDAEVRVRGLLGIPLMLVSELFAFHGTGTVADSKWTPKLLGSGAKTAPVGAPAAAPPATGEPPKKRGFFQRFTPRKQQTP
ncbi:MAG: hypothetical protein IPK32_13785 [Verrucomicrobiaceae bacterium]|nr:hypothetical protein [Verrucomicrobiaceae bacterium]